MLSALRKIVKWLLGVNWCYVCGRTSEPEMLIPLMDGSHICNDCVCKGTQ